MQYRVTDIPDAFFVRNQLNGFMEDREGKKTFLIHDGSGEFVSQNYKELEIHNIRLSPESPDMNAYAERFIGSLRRECLDWFIMFSYDQLNGILKEYIAYYNELHPHQGIMQNIPKGYLPQTGKGRILKKPILSGLWNHYYRETA
ncbi:MAG: transposase [Spirochaetales bacterium]|nr:transposase [Spirochaetales bacterium]